MTIAELYPGDERAMQLDDLARVADMIDAWCGEQWDGTGAPVDPDLAYYAGMVLLSASERARQA